MDGYRHSGVIPVSAIAGTMLAGLAVTFFGGAVYALAMRYVPIIYINVFLTAMYGFVIGLVVGLAGQMGKIRNPAAAHLLGVTFGLIGVYCEWAWSAYAINARFGLSAFQPTVLFEFAAELYEKGSWGLGRGNMVKGPPLAVLWVIEAGMIVFLCWISATLYLEAPFCEPCNEWTNVEENAVLFACTGDEPEWAAVKEGRWSVLQSLPVGVTDAGKAVRVRVAQCPKCTESRYASAHLMVYTVDKDGQTHEIAVPFMDWLRLDAAGLELLNSKRAELLGTPTEGTDQAPAEPSDSAAAPAPPVASKPRSFAQRDDAPVDLLTEFDDRK